MNRRDAITYGSIIGGTALLTAVLGMGAHKAGQIYNAANPNSITSPVPAQESNRPKFQYVTNLSNAVYDSVRRLDQVYRAQYGRGLPVFHIGQNNDHYIVIRGSYENEVFEAYLKTDRWGNLMPNTPVTIARALPEEGKV